IPRALRRSAKRPAVKINRLSFSLGLSSMLSSTVEIRLMPPLGGPDARPYRAATRELRSNQLPYAAEQAMSCAAAMTQKATDQRSRDLSDREEVRRLVHFGANALDQG